MKCIKEIESFLNNDSVFFSDLKDNRYFDKELFQKYLMCVYTLSEENLTINDKYHIAILIWEIAFIINSIIGEHFSGDGSMKIINLDNDEALGIENLVYYVANWFSYGKPLQLEMLEIAKWK